MSRFQYLSCSNSACRLRFPGVPDINCPLCESATLCPEFSPKVTPDARPRGASPPLELILDNIRSAFNVGSIFRSADGAGVQQIYLCGITPPGDHPSVAKTSLGAESTVPWSYHRNSNVLADRLLATERELWSLECQSGSQSLFQIREQETSNNIVLVMGNEVCGIDPELRLRSAKVLHIPMNGFKVSLNVATAAGIAAYHVANCLNASCSLNGESILDPRLLSENAKEQKNKQL